MSDIITCESFDFSIGQRPISSHAEVRNSGLQNTRYTIEIIDEIILSNIQLAYIRVIKYHKFRVGVFQYTLFLG